MGEFCSHCGVLCHRLITTGSTNQRLEPLQSEPNEYKCIFKFMSPLSQGKLTQGEMESKHALCNTKPECQGDRDIEAPVAGDDGVQPTFIRVLRSTSTHKHQGAGPCGVEHLCGSKNSSETY